MKNGLQFQPEKSKCVEPRDRFRLVFVLFFLLGILHLLPFTFFNNATSYYMYKFRNITSNSSKAEERTPLQAEYNAAIQTTIETCDVTSLIITFFFGHLIKLKVRMNVGVFCISCIFILCTAIVKIDTDHWQELFYAITLISAGLVVVCIAVLTITIFTIISFFPQPYFASYFNGGALSGVINAILQILWISTGLSVMDSALFYFLYSVLLGITTLSVTLYVTLTKNEFFFYHLRHFKEGTKESISFTEMKSTVKYIWPSLYVMACHFLTQDFNPIFLVVSQYESTGTAWNKTYFVPTITFLVGSICNLIGTALAFRVHLSKNPIVLVVVSTVRMAILIPAFLLCNAQPRHHLPVLLPHDYQFIILVIIYYLSAGYLSGLASENIRWIAPKEEVKASLKMFMVSYGTIMGVLSFISMATVKII